MFFPWFGWIWFSENVISVYTQCYCTDRDVSWRRVPDSSLCIYLISVTACFVWVLSPCVKVCVFDRQLWCDSVSGPDSPDLEPVLVVFRSLPMLACCLHMKPAKSLCDDHCENSLHVFATEISANDASVNGSTLDTVSPLKNDSRCTWSPCWWCKLLLLFLWLYASRPKSPAQSHSSLHSTVSCVFVRLCGWFSLASFIIGLRLFVLSAVTASLPSV